MNVVLRREAGSPPSADEVGQIIRGSRLHTDCWQLPSDSSLLGRAKTDSKRRLKSYRTALIVCINAWFDMFRLSVGSLTRTSTSCSSGVQAKFVVDSQSPEDKDNTAV